MEYLVIITKIYKYKQYQVQVKLIVMILRHQGLLDKMVNMV